MSCNTYDKGDLLRLTFTITNSAGTAIDPTTMTIKYKNPEGTTTSKVYGTDAEVIKSSTGVYYIDVSLDFVGRWHYRGAGTGTGQCSTEGTFVVRDTHF